MKCAMTEQLKKSEIRVETAPVPRCNNSCALGPAESVKDADFGVKFGELRTCGRCGWRLYDDWTAMRAGSVERWLPPQVHTEQADGDDAHPQSRE